ncbi:hypothetical protein MPSEU_000509100 [Mayamaea pseudoterrestris]|nr:hypothetical protein MPSEU_000509100 [Mayamaea pseudoterrestris]
MITSSVVRGEKNGNSYRQRADHMPMLIGLPPIPLVSLPTLLLSSKLSVVCSCLCCSNRVFFAPYSLVFLIMTLVRFPGALKEFGGASPAFRLPIQTKASTTWLGEETPKREERAAAMELQIDGWTEGQVVLTKEEVYALNKEMTKQEGLDGDGKHMWHGTPTRLKLLTTENIGGILTLSSLRKQYSGAGAPGADETHPGKEQLVIICSAMPSGTALGEKYSLHDTKLGHSVTNGPEMDNEGLSDTDDPVEPTLLLSPSGFDAPQAMVPILASLSRQTRAPLQSTREEWFEEIKMDMAVFPRGDKMLQPVMLCIHEEELPDAGSFEHELIGGTGHWEGPPLYQYGEKPVLAYATDRELQHSTTKIWAEQLKAHCIAFTGLPNEVYDWMDDNRLLTIWLKGCRESADDMKTETWIMSQVTATWEAWKEKSSLLAQQTFHHPELVIRSKILWDHLVHTLEPNWHDKLILLGQNAQTIFQNSPQMAKFHETRMENMWYLAGLLNIKTSNWCKQFEINFLRQGLPSWLDRFARVDISASTSAADLAKLRIVTKTSHMENNTPSSAATTRSRPPIGDLVAQVFNDWFSAGVGSPLQLKHNDPDRNPPSWYDDERRKRADGLPGTAKTLFVSHHQTSEDGDSVKYVGSKRPPNPPSTPPRMKLPQRHQPTVQLAVASGLYLPFEQLTTQMQSYMTEPAMGTLIYGTVSYKATVVREGRHAQLRQLPIRR